MSGIDRRRSQRVWHLVRLLRKYFLFLISFVLFAISVFFYVEVERHRASAEPASPAKGGGE